MSADSTQSWVVPPKLTGSPPTLVPPVGYREQEEGDARAAEAHGAWTEPIAIIGMACRFPQAPDADAFWCLLQEGRDAITEVPAERWDAEAFYSADSRAPGKANSRWGGFLAQVDQFDPLFFGISPREAIHMDPQQRLALELAWEAVESAGLAPGSLMDSRTGVFMGAMWNDYARLAQGALESIGAHTATGQDSSIIAARVSYFLGLRGPSLTVNTASSSSLVAVHLACQSLLRGESSLAIAGGVNLILAPETTVAMSQLGTQSPDGRCRAFDARANGYVRGEGGGLVVLKLLSRALAEGDTVLGIIRGGAVNNDGASSGLTAPSPKAQEDMLREAYARAGVRPDAVHYVEAHGTGTLLGDPIEAHALGAVLGAGRAEEHPLVIGSVKTNIGHLEAAAGIAGLIKTVLALRHREIPPNLHFEQPNPHIPFEALRLRVPCTRLALPPGDVKVWAGVSSFGFGGTNCHLVLESPLNKVTAALPEPEEQRFHLLPLSAHTEEALVDTARAFEDSLARRPEVRLEELCYSASVGRATHAHAVAFVADSRRALEEHLRAFVEGESRPGRVVGVRAPERPRVVFVFPGQGSQWVGMGRELLRQEPVFREALEACDEAIRACAGWSLLEQLLADESQSRMQSIEVIQPTLFAVEVALAALWRSWGVVPDAVVGHSMGEVAAAYVAGALGLQDAVRIICERSRLMRRVAGQGGMALVELGLEQARALLGTEEGRVSIAASNSPRSTVLSGDASVLETLLKRLEQEGTFCRRVKVDVASHSPQVEPLREDLLRALSGLSPRAAALPLYSTVTGEPVDGTRLDESYWMRNLREPVLFSGTIERLGSEGFGVFMELSPHPILLPSIEQTLRHGGHAGLVLASLRRQEPERAVMLESLGTFFTAGGPVDFRRLYPRGGRRVPLPAFAWQRQRFWLDMDRPSAGTRRATRRPGSDHPLLGERLPALAHAPKCHVWENPRVDGVGMLSGAAYLDMGVSAAARVLGQGVLRLSGVDLGEPLELSAEEAWTLQLCLLQGEAHGGTFQVHGRASPDAPWILQAAGSVRREDGEEARSEGAALWAKVEEIRAQGREELEQRWVRGAEGVSRLSVPKTLEPALSACSFHPAVLELGLESLFHLAQARGTESVARLKRVESLRLLAAPVSQMWCYARLRPPQGPEAHGGDILFFDDSGRLLAEVRGVGFVRVPRKPRAQVPEAVRGDFRSRLRESPAPARRALLQSFLREETAQVLRLPSARIELSRSLKSLGMDSLLTLELRNRLEAKLGLTLPATLLWNFPTLVALCTFLAERMEIALEEAVALAPAEDLAELSGLSEEEGLAMIGLLKQLQGLSDEELLRLVDVYEKEEVFS